MTDNYLNPNQARRTSISDYDEKLAGAIEEIFGTGAHDVAGLVSGLGAANIIAPDGKPWTEEALVAHLKPYGD
jgi:hypothetical protein